MHRLSAEVTDDDVSPLERPSWVQAIEWGELPSAAVELRHPDAERPTEDSHDLAGADFYDDPNFFDAYMRRRERVENPNDTLERPVVHELLGAVQGLEFLDLGCGDAAFGTDLLARGALLHVGVDCSANMIDTANRALAGTAGKAIRANVEEWAYPVDLFDRATARLVLHYLADLERVFAQINRALKRNGQFVFSVEHLVITSPDEGWDHAGAARRMAY